MRTHERLHAVLSQLPRYLLALVPVAVATVGVALLGALHIANASLLYLAAVLVVAVTLGRGPAIATSIAAFLAFDFFFTEPRFTFTVRDPEVWLTLITFLLVAVVTGQLAAVQRQRAEDAEAREREARLLHDLSNALASQKLKPALEAVAERLRAELHLRAVAIELKSPETGLGRLVAGDTDAIQLARQAGGSVSVLGEGEPAAGDRPAVPGRFVRVAAPHGPRRIAEESGLVRIPIRGTAPQPMGDLLLVTGKDGRTIDAPDARLLATAAGQLALAIEQDRLQQEATEAEVLRRTDDLRTALIDAVAHDLRTPLASIIASAGSLRGAEMDWTDEERREFAGAIEQEAERLNRIVGNLLDLSRIQGGTLVPARDWHDPGLVVRDAVERLRPGLGGRRVEVVTADDLAPVFLDPVEIDQVVANLVENAAKYTPPEGAIRVVSQMADGELRVSVSDDGPGIPPAAIAHLFEPFYRAPGTGRIQGSGLGLAVARGLVDAHDGRIWVENLPDGGARFSFTIPAPAAPAEVGR